jgi:hypothetical protein
MLEPVVLVFDLPLNESKKFLEVVFTFSNLRVLPLFLMLDLTACLATDSRELP